MTRPYRLQRRAERQDDTRRRIVESTVALHQEVGMLQTSVSAIAERAGVQRATVYRHFPDERSLLTACIGHFYDEHPFPDAEAWALIDDPEIRLRRALTDIYAFHLSTAPMLSTTLAQIPAVPAAQEVLVPVVAYWRRVREILADGWCDDARRGVVAAAIGHAIAFPTWQSLVRNERLDNAQAVDLMVGLVVSAAQGRGSARVLPEMNDTLVHAPAGA